FASTEDPKSRYVLQALQISPLIDSIVSGAEGLIQGTDAVFVQNIEPNLPPVMGDPVAISQCLQNLISNAVKYGGEHPRLTLRVFAAPSENAEGRELLICVDDCGIGIDSAELSSIFDPFYRSPRGNAARIHGTGLGLSLAKRIAESMGARLSVVSELSVGSTFTLHLRIAKGDELQTAMGPSRPASTLST